MLFRDAKTTPRTAFTWFSAALLHTVTGPGPGDESVCLSAGWLVVWHFVPSPHSVASLGPARRRRCCNATLLLCTWRVRDPFTSSSNVSTPPAHSLFLQRSPSIFFRLGRDIRFRFMYDKSENARVRESCRREILRLSITSEADANEDLTVYQIIEY